MSMTTEELVWVFVTYPSPCQIEDIQLAWWVSDVVDELTQRPDVPSVIRSWGRLLRMERQHLGVDRQRLRRRLNRLYRNAMESQFCQH